MQRDATTRSEPGERVLIVEDEPMVAEVVQRYLSRDGYDVRVEHDGAAGLDAARQWQPDLVVLDLMLPRMPGIDVCRQLRADGDTPVIILTARGDEVDKLLGLHLGADDYVTKPFSPRELAARVRAVLRRSARSDSTAGDAESLRHGSLHINARSRAVRDHRGPIDLTAREFDLLFHLARHPNQVFTREQLLTSLWDLEFDGDASTVTVHVRRLRAKVEADPSRPRHIKTVWGVGYKFEP
jgi:DNA-binding response OmpR family regulator